MKNGGGVCGLTPPPFGAGVVGKPGMKFGGRVGISTKFGGRVGFSDYCHESVSER